MRKFKLLAKKASHPDLTAYALESIYKKKPFKETAVKTYSNPKKSLPHNSCNYTAEGILQRIINKEWIYTPELFDYIEAHYQHTIALTALKIDKSHPLIGGDTILENVRALFKAAVKNYDDETIIRAPNFKSYIIKYITYEFLEEVVYSTLNQEQEVMQQIQPSQKTKPISSNHLQELTPCLKV